MFKFFRSLFTEDDAGTTACPVRVFGGMGTMTFLGNSCWTVFHSGTFDYLAFGAGFAALIGALGGAIGVKAKLGADLIKAAPPTAKPDKDGGD